MKKKTKAIIGSLLVMLLIAVTVLVFEIRRRPTPTPVPGTASLSITAPPAPTGTVSRVAPISSRRTAIRKTLRCLRTLCDTGASADSVSKTRALVAQLDATRKPFAHDLSAALTSALSSLDSAHRSATPIPTLRGVPDDLLDRAAAACDARGRRIPGEIVLSFAGDCTFGTVNGNSSDIRFPSVYEKSGRRDYPFALVKPWLLNDDLSIVNFECTLTDAVPTADKQWHFKGPARYASILPAGSVEAVGLSNNHSLDYLQSGFDDTVSNFQKAHVPTFFQNKPYVTTLQGVQTVIIGDCTVVGENTTEIDGAPERVLGEIKRYKKPDNIVIVVMHWGSELDTMPRVWQQEMGRRFIDAGADAVVGHHPHVVQGMELYKGKYIAYSLGNFAFGGNSLARSPETFLLRLRFREDAGKTTVLPASIVPCWTTSSGTKNAAEVLQNNYQPKPVFGKVGDQTVDLVLARSSVLRYGMKSVDYWRGGVS